VVHTGDFKVDWSPPDGRLLDVRRFAELGEEGVAVLLSDSTNAEREGTSASESQVGEAMARIFGAPYARGRIVVAMFGSNIHRVQSVVRAALQHGRKVCLLGRSIQQNVRLALDMGSAGDIQELVGVVLDGLLEAIAADVGAILSVKESRKLEVLDHRQREPGAKAYRPVSEYVSNEVLDSREAILAVDGLEHVKSGVRERQHQHVADRLGIVDRENALGHVRPPRSLGRRSGFVAGGQRLRRPLLRRVGASDRAFVCAFTRRGAVGAGDRGPPPDRKRRHLRQ